MNTKKKEVIIYTSKTCAYCKNLKEGFKKEGIDFTERTNDEYPGEWYKVNFLTGLPMFPTIVIGDTILVAERDFRNVDHAINTVDYITGAEYPNYSQQSLLLEEIKTLNYNVNNMFRQLNQAINNINKKYGNKSTS